MSLSRLFAIKGSTVSLPCLGGCAQQAVGASKWCGFEWQPEVEFTKKKKSIG